MKRKSSDIVLYSTSQEAWDAMSCAIKKASSSIYWEVYTFVDDDSGNTFISLLKEKAKAGVVVKLLVDAFGSSELSKDAIDAMTAVGVDVRLFSAQHTKNILTRWQRLWTRTHRKLLIIDETVGFIGGVNIQHSMSTWKDIHVRVHGPAVRSLLRSFAKSYVIAGGKNADVQNLLKYKFRLAKSVEDLEFIYDEPNTKQSRVRKKYVEALTKARERVILFSPYYFPDRKFLRALWSARKRGIKVDLLIPFRSDIRIATYAAYALFSLMRHRGVRVHLMKDMMHGKGVIVDDDWAMIGSSNIDQTSFYDNYEANIRFTDKHVVQQLKAIVTGWLSSSEMVQDNRWEHRGRYMRLKEWISLKLYRLWYRSNEKIDTVRKRRNNK
ncbi:MAG: hypothetical protein COV60_00085 [Candidatus Magasanikbacteria bacterium CG11_big_fil_rev_8_21_14_0_20_43_7]|uniref:PLD phosphodiesterase domain-containing protein n=1 Tax=Candidatus Magasanikbacteria bacterium CG11_big_fil_rev_8_21_14_0_20_43_7 TaxID=1974654 RepID=A0A2H0N5T1_9BACT|nr:MAG: hypothetical protein COV60_00085 [Candidatus Magasanikbacteria bacterium CG11_big_fil_rev_8_21_14_0_20_43_7]